MRWPFRRARPAPVDRPDWIDESGWHAVLDAHPFLARLDDHRRARLRGLCGAFVGGKAITGVQGFVADQAVVAGIAVQACLPILELGLDAYPAFDEIVVHPSDFVIDREVVDEDGVVHAWREAAAGESWSGGPLVLSWDAVRPATSKRPTPTAFNVVVHEFVHKLDMTNGAVDGMPAFSRRLHPDLSPAHWRSTLDAAFDDFNERLDAVERSIPRHVDPDSARADRYFASLPLDTYAATDEGEFFSVSSEAFFVAPEPLAAAYPEWYRSLAAYFLQDPMADGAKPR